MIVCLFCGPRFAGRISVWDFHESSLTQNCSEPWTREVEGIAEKSSILGFIADCFAIAASPEQLDSAAQTTNYGQVKTNIQSEGATS
jgi:hypothetical protein